jgi:hypothetical protein
MKRKFSLTTEATITTEIEVEIPDDPNRSDQATEIALRREADKVALNMSQTKDPADPAGWEINYIDYGRLFIETQSPIRPGGGMAGQTEEAESEDQPASGTSLDGLFPG